MQNNLNNPNNANDNKALDSVLMFFLTLVIIFLMMVNAAYPAMLTWNLWIPTHFGLPELSLPFAVMLYLTFALFKGGTTSRTEDNRSKETKNNDIIIMFASPWIVYVIAYVTYKFFIV